MKIIFFGSSNFAVPALEALLKEGQELTCVVTQPDKKKGRHLVPAATEVKSTALAAGLKVFQPREIKAAESLRYLKKYKPDLLVIVAYGQLLSRELLDIPGIMPLNIHASLLPAYRGAAPINWALINGEKNTGVTIMKVTPRMDSGPLISQARIKISAEDTAVTLDEKLGILGAELLLKTIKDIAKGTFKLLPQEESRASFAPKLKKEDGLINWQRPAEEIHNLVRGTLPWPGAFTHYKGKLLKLHSCSVAPLEKCPPANAGEIIRTSREGIIVAAGGDCLTIGELQPEAGRRMSAAEFISGHNILPGERFV